MHQKLTIKKPNWQSLKKCLEKNTDFKVVKNSTKISNIILEKNDKLYLIYSYSHSFTNYLKKGQKGFDINKKLNGGNVNNYCNKMLHFTIKFKCKIEDYNKKEQ